MSTEARMLEVIAHLNAHNAGGDAAEQLVPEVHGHTDSAGLREFFAVCDQSGRVAAIGYSESELLANLEAILAETVHAVVERAYPGFSFGALAERFADRPEPDLAGKEPQ